MYRKTNKTMNKIGVQFRKIDINDNNRKYNPTERILKKQMRTLHKKLKKNDKGLTVTYVIEKDTKWKFHTHLLIHYTDEKNLCNELSRFIGGTSWYDKESSSYPIKACDGKYGEVHTHYIYDEKEFICNYMNKFSQSKSLV